MTMTGAYLTLTAVAKNYFGERTMTTTGAMTVDDLNKEEKSGRSKRRSRF